MCRCVRVDGDSSGPGVVVSEREGATGAYAGGTVGLENLVELYNRTVEG